MVFHNEGEGEGEGEGIMYLKDKKKPVRAPKTIYIPANALYGIEAKSNLGLMYMFDKGPFNTIKYVFSSKDLNPKSKL